MRAIWLLASRYVWSRRQERFIAVIGGIAVLGVALGVAALIVVIGVMTGFDEDLQGKILGANAHVIVQADGAAIQPEPVLAQLRGLPGVVAAAPFVQGQMLVSSGSASTGVLLRGMDPAREGEVTAVARYLTAGSLDPGAEGVILGRELARRLGVAVGDVVKVVTPASRAPQPLTVAGFFASGMYDYDVNLAMTRVETAQRLLGVAEGVTGVGVRVADPLRADRVKREIQRVLGYPYGAMTWMEQNRNLFAALRLEKITMFLILTLIVLVACFNIVATLLMMVVERTRDIGILRALGATGPGIRMIFTLVGLILGGTGTLLGLVGGVGLCEFLQRSHWVKLPPDIYYLDHLPAQVVWPDVGFIVAAALVISWLACLYPAAVAARLKPVEALRYE